MHSWAQGGDAGDEICNNLVSYWLFVLRCAVGQTRSCSEDPSAGRKPCWLWGQPVHLITRQHRSCLHLTSPAVNHRQDNNAQPFYSSISLSHFLIFFALTFLRRSVGVEVHKSANTDLDQGSSHRYRRQWDCKIDVFFFSHARVSHCVVLIAFSLCQFWGRSGCR